MKRFTYQVLLMAAFQAILRKEALFTLPLKRDRAKLDRLDATQSIGSIRNSILKPENYPERENCTEQE